jgi:hypothetical protein
MCKLGLNAATLVRQCLFARLSSLRPHLEERPKTLKSKAQQSAGQDAPSRAYSCSQSSARSKNPIGIGGGIKLLKKINVKSSLTFHNILHDMYNKQSFGFFDNDGLAFLY